MSEKFDYYQWPTTDFDKPMGKFYIQPVRGFTTKGHWWHESIEFTLEATLINASLKPIVYRHWANPKLKQAVGDMVRLDDGSPCMCEKCVAGRKQVEAGWTPWGKDF